MKMVGKEKELHENLLYPCVRIRCDRGAGSGTVIYSDKIPGQADGPDEIIEYETYVLTNWHIVEDHIKVGKEWSNLLQRDVKKDILSDVDIEFFSFEYGSWESGHSGFRGEIVAYHKEADIALLKLKKSSKTDYVAKFFPKGQEKKKLRMFQECYAIGCGMGHPPIATIGHLNCFTDIIENYPYWMQSGPIIYGNSGGAVFLKESYEYIGMPARVVVSGGFVADAITHMSFFIPITTIYKFLDDYVYQFIYDKNYDSKKCERIRRREKQRDEKMMMGETAKEEGTRAK